VHVLDYQIFSGQHTNLTFPYKMSFRFLILRSPQTYSVFYRQGTFAAIAGDRTLPGLGGHHFVRTLRVDSRLSDLPVIAATVRAIANDRKKAMAAGFKEYLAKPVEPEEIMATVRRSVNAHNQCGNSPTA
jgi:CheY-like chemotaxis protein